MRKILLTVILSLVMATTTSNFTCIAEPQTQSKESPEKLTHDTLLTTLSPYIQESVNKYYGYPKQFALWDAKILNVRREIEGGFTFFVKVQVSTFENAHNPPYGKETVTLEVSPFGIKVTQFHHKDE